MRRSLTTLAVFTAVLAAGLSAHAATPARMERSIVVLRAGVDSPGSVASEHARAHGVAVRFVYGSALKGLRGRYPVGSSG